MSWVQIAAATRRVTVLGKQFTPIVPLFTKVRQAAKLVAALLMVAGVTAGLAESNGSLLPRVYDSCHLQADCKEPGSAPEPALGNRVYGPALIYIDTVTGER